MRRLLALLLSAFLPAAAWAAVSAQAITPLNTSVLGGERLVYTARFLDASGRGAAGETVFFSNDACGWFDNGSFGTSVVTDALGFASVGFTARAQGITCWITAQAGASVTFNVFTYTIGQVGVTGSVFPPEPRAGEPINFNVAVAAGAYPVYGARVAARVVPEGAASLAEMPGAGESGRTSYTVVRAGPEPFEIEVTYRSIVRRFAIAGLESPLQDMWWGGSGENGWGMSLVQHGERLFAAIYAYDASGAPTWYVMPGGTWNAARTAFTGPLYSPRSAPYTAYDASRLDVGAPVGTATIGFTGSSEATLDYTVNGVSGRKLITRQLFGPAETTPAPLKAGDMWWGGASQNGWGVAILQQHRTLFGVWFTYDADGKPTWFVMPSGFWADPQTWQGRIYRATSSPWAGQPYDPTRLSTSEVGGFTLRFSGDSATLAYTIDGRSGTMALVRQDF